jgi:hypothetical protein
MIDGGSAGVPVFVLEPVEESAHSVSLPLSVGPNGTLSLPLAVVDPAVVPDAPVECRVPLV